jgi:homoserine acetyltransferase
VFVSANAIRPQRKARTRDAIGDIRHVFLDADRDGPAVLAAIAARRDVPPPSCVIHTSPNRLHVLWRVTGFSKEELEALQKRLASDPNWNGGWYYDNGGIARTLEEIRFETLMNYGQNEILAETMPDPKAREAAIRANAKAWSQIYDGHSMVVLRRAIGSFDITADYAKLKNTKVLYVQSPSDKLFDIALSPGYVSDMRKAGIDITYVELPTNKGHMASHADAALWAPILGAFLKRLT